MLLAPSVPAKLAVLALYRMAVRPVLWPKESHCTSSFLKHNQNNFLLGTVTSAGLELVGPLVRLKDCSLSSGTASDESCGVAHVHLLPGAAFPAVGERIACSGRLVNASSVGALLKDATWTPEAQWRKSLDEAQKGKPKPAFDAVRLSEMANAHLQAAAAILTGLSYTSCDDERMQAMLKGLRQPLDGPHVWSKDLLATEYEAVTCEQGFDYLFRCLAGAAEVADRLISEHRRPELMLKSLQLIDLRNRIEAALLTLAEMTEARRLVREGHTG